MSERARNWKQTVGRGCWGAAACVTTMGAGDARGKVISDSHAPDLIGGIASFTFAVRTGPSSFFVFNEGAPIVAGMEPDSIVAAVSGAHEWKGQTYGWGARLDLAGPTETSAWSLTHTGTDTRVYIMSVILSSQATPESGAVFDDGSEPSTPGSGPGTPQALTVSGPGVINTGFDPAYLWGGWCNTGDLYTNVLVQWADLNNHMIFGTGTTARWRLDTDVVPEPPAVAALLLMACAVRRRRRAG